MKQIGIVKSVSRNSDEVTVEVVRKSACEMCEKSGECHVCGLISGNRNVSVTVKNTLGAKVGDRVELESSTISILSYAAAVFLLPIVIAIGLYLIYSRFCDVPQIGFLVSFLGLLVSVCVICFVLNKRIEKKKGIVITRIIEPLGKVD